MDFASLGKHSALAALIASCLASAYLIGVFRKLAPTSRKKLLARQLLHLAVADLIFSVAEIQTAILDFAVASAFRTGRKEGSEDGLLYGVCKANSASNEFGRAAALSLECHLALAFAASTFRSARGLDALSRVLPFVWLFALLWAFLSSFMADDFWQGTDQGACGSRGPRWSILVLVPATFAMCLICYAWSVCRAYGAAEIRQNSVWYRVQGYLIVAVLFTAPYALYNAEAALKDNVAHEQASDIALHVTGTLYNLSGLLNAMVYLLLSRHARRLFRKHGMGLVPRLSFETEEQYSYRVSFRNGGSLHDAEQRHPTSSYFAEMFLPPDGDSDSRIDGEVRRRNVSDLSEDVGWAPQCLTCMQTMRWIIPAQGGPPDFWCCRSCPADSESSIAGERWSCRVCGKHSCGRCGRMSQARAAASLDQVPWEPPHAEAVSRRESPPAHPLAALGLEYKRRDQEQAMRAKIQTGLDRSDALLLQVPIRSPRTAMRSRSQGADPDSDPGAGSQSPSVSVSSSFADSATVTPSPSPSRSRASRN